MKKYLKFLVYILTNNYKTFYFNFRYFSFQDAIIYPVLISKNVYLKSLEGKVLIENKSSLKYGMIRIGYGDVGIFDNQKSRSVLQIFGTLIFNGTAQIGHGSKISIGKKGRLIIGNNFKITAETAIVTHKEIVIGQNCLFSWEILIMDTDFHAIHDLQLNQLNLPEKIGIGNNVWIGCRSTVLKGSEIPNGSVIGASSLVTSKFISENTIYSGVPARLLKTNILWANKSI